MPSLPVAGTERPPVARITREAWMAPADVSSRQPRAFARERGDGCAELEAHTAAPRQRDEPVAHVARAVRPREQLARLAFERQREADLVLEEAPLGRERPGPKHPAKQGAGESVTNRSGAMTEGRMLQRPPPLIRILRPPSAVRSSTTTGAGPSAAKMAATRPAAPAPTTTVGSI